MPWRRSLVVTLVVTAVVIATASSIGCGSPACPATKHRFIIDGVADGSVGGVHIDSVTTDGADTVVSLAFTEPFALRFTALDPPPALVDDTVALAFDAVGSPDNPNATLYVRLTDGAGTVLEGGVAEIVSGTAHGAPEVDGALVADPKAKVTSCARGDKGDSEVEATFATDDGPVLVPIGESKPITVGGVPMLAVGLGGSASSSVDGASVTNPTVPSGLTTIRAVRGYAYRVAP